MPTYPMPTANPPAGVTALSAFLAFCAQRNPRFVCAVPQRTPYEQMLADLHDGDPAVLQALAWARRAQNASAAAILVEWRRWAERERASLRSILRVSHRLAAAPPQAALDGLRVWLGEASAPLLAFYRQHDGAGLFVDEEDGGSGLFFFAIAEMEAEREAIAERLEQPAVETVEDGRLQVFGRPQWLDRALVFGGFGYVPERLVLPTDGEHRGSVFLFSHDPLQLTRISLSFGDLLDQLRQQPTILMGGYGGPAYQAASAYEADGRLLRPRAPLHGVPSPTSWA